MSGEMEERLRKSLRRTKLQSAILTSLEVGGVLAIAVMAPNVVQLLGRRYKQSDTPKVRNAVTRLLSKGLVTIADKDGRKCVSITTKGRRLLDNDPHAVPRPATWDGKWRIVTFDIAEPRRKHRTLLRQTLQEIGFERLQDSVWVYPYDCEELITLLKADYGLGKEVLYIIADSIENDRALRGRFKLS